MGKCEQRTYAYAVLAVSPTITEGSTVVLQGTTLTLPRFSLNSPDPPPTGLPFVGDGSGKTDEQTPAGALGLLAKVAGYGGTIDSKLHLEFSMYFYSDCHQKCCIKGKLTGIQAELLYQYPMTIKNITLTEPKVDFADVSFGGDCKPPKWKLCCSGSDKIELKLSKTEIVSGKLVVGITGKANLEYEIWEPSGQESEKSKGVAMAHPQSDGTVKFALKSGSSVVPLPPELGGSVAVANASGFFVVKPLKRDGCMQSFALTELAYRAPSIKLANGRDTGINRVLLAPGPHPHGTIDMDTGRFEVAVDQIILNDLWDEAHPVRVQSRVIGFYDQATGELEMMTQSYDTFPPLDVREPPAKG